MTDGLAYSYRNARSPAITTAICAVVVIESVAVHFAVSARHPGIAWVLTLTSLAAVLWLIRDYRAMGAGVVRISDDGLCLRVGRRFDFTVPLAQVAQVFKPSFRDLPALGTTQGRDYLNLTKPATPNVLIVLDTMQRVRLPAGLHRDVRRVALRLDDPDGFLRAIHARRPSTSARSA